MSNMKVMTFLLIFGYTLQLNQSVDVVRSRYIAQTFVVLGTIVKNASLWKARGKIFRNTWFFYIRDTKPLTLGDFCSSPSLQDVTV